VNAQARDVAEREANQNRHQRLLVDLPRNGSGRSTTRIHDMLSNSARLRPSLLCRFSRVAQHFFRLTDCRRGRLGSVLNSPAATRPAADVDGQPAINQLNRGSSFYRQAPDGCMSWLLLRRDGSKSHLRDLCRLIYADAQAAREIAGLWGG